MKFWVPKTLRGAHSPIIIINWIFGVGVIEIPFGKPRRILSAFWSIANFVIHLTFVLMTDFPRVTEFQGSKGSANNSRITAYFCVAFIGISVFVAPLRTKTIKASFVKVVTLNRKLRILGIPENYDVTFKNHVIQLSVAFAATSILMILDFKFIGSDLPSETSRVGFVLGSHYLLLFAFVVDCSFSSIVRYAGNRFRFINRLLTESEQSNSVAIRRSEEQSLRYYSLIIEIHRNYSFLFKTAERQSLFYVIRETRRIHRDLSKAAVELNSAFAIQILLSMALSFGMMTSLSYTLYVFITSSLVTTFRIDVIISRLIALIWFTFYAMKVFLIVQACEITSSEAKKTGTLISKLLYAPTCDEDIRDEINIFLLQLIQNPLNFTANGFFPLNHGLICGMIGSVTTYLIIMIQMQSVYESNAIVGGK